MTLGRQTKADATLVCGKKSLNELEQGNGERPVQENPVKP